MESTATGLVRWGGVVRREVERRTKESVARPPPGISQRLSQNGARPGSRGGKAEASIAKVGIGRNRSRRAAQRVTGEVSAGLVAAGKHNRDVTVGGPAARDGPLYACNQGNQSDGWSPWQETGKDKASIGSFRRAAT